MRYRLRMPCSCKQTDLFAAMAGFSMGVFVGQLFLWVVP